jgi:hypothetical protein
LASVVHDDVKGRIKSRHKSAKMLEQSYVPEEETKG